MLTKVIQNESESLRLKLEHYKELFDKSISDRDPLEKTKIIFHELKKVMDTLDNQEGSKPTLKSQPVLKNTQPNI